MVLKLLVIDDAEKAREQAAEKAREQAGNEDKVVFGDFVEKIQGI